MGAEGAVKVVESNVGNWCGSFVATRLSMGDSGSGEGDNKGDSYGSRSRACVSSWEKPGLYFGTGGVSRRGGVMATGAMTKRPGMTRQGCKGLQKSEARRQATAGTRRRLGKAVGCRVRQVYIHKEGLV